jgi:protein-L-isoaspartate O-methyltransferase
MDWKARADRLAAEVTHPASRWRPLVAAMPRHVFVPRWWAWSQRGPSLWHDTWELRDGPADPAAWLDAAYSDKSLVTRVGPLHADHAGPADRPTGRPTSSTTMPGLVVHMYRHAMIGDGMRVLDVGTGSGYGCALLTRRLVTTITGTALIITADKRPDGGATGRAEWDRAGFMHARAGLDYPPGLPEQFGAIHDADGDHVGAGRYPVANITMAWDLFSAVGVTVPGVQHHYQENEDGRRTAWLLHPDGSWARATAMGDDPPVVHQAGPRRLWDTVDELRHAWLRDGSLPGYGSSVAVDPDGTLHLERGQWKATIPPDAR